MAQKDRTFIMTPEGVADWPYLFEPDTKFKVEGEYKTTLKVPASDAADAFFEELEAHAERAFQAAARQASKRPPKKAELPAYKDAEGNVVLKARMVASGVRKSDGQRFTQAPRVFDARNRAWDRDIQIRSGSILRLYCEVVSYNTPTLGSGISLRLKDVQVIKASAGYSSVDDSPFGKAVADEAPPKFAEGDDDDSADF